MKLLDCYEDLFQYVCRLNRAAKAQAPLEYSRVRDEVKELLERVKRDASAEAHLHHQVERLKLTMIFFVDYLICSSRLQLAAQWAENRLAYEEKDLAGDERFFNFLDEDLNDPSQEASDRLAVYYVCLGLGFMGMYESQPEKVREYSARIFPRVRQHIDLDSKTPISPEAYQRTDARVLTEPPSNKIILVTIAFIFLSLSVLAVCCALYVNASGVLTGSIDQIINQGRR